VVNIRKRTVVTTYFITIPTGTLYCSYNKNYDPFSL